jgi:hypothetical protein
LTAAARDGRIPVRAGMEEWLRRGQTKEWHQKGEQNALRPDTLIPSPQPSTKPGQVHVVRWCMLERAKQPLFYTLLKQR